MTFKMIGSVNSYANMVKMKGDWQLKKSGLDPKAVQGGKQQDSGVLNMLQKQLESNKQSEALQAIQNKLSSGSTLSMEEMAYLREKCPDMYQRALRVQAERAAFERAMKECRTQEEVQYLRMQQTTALVPKAKEAQQKNDLAASIEINAKANTQQKDYLEFVNSAEYQSLPKNEQELEESKKKDGVEEQSEGETPPVDGPAEQPDADAPAKDQGAEAAQNSPEGEAPKAAPEIPAPAAADKASPDKAVQPAHNDAPPAAPAKADKTEAEQPHNSDRRMNIMA